MVTAFGKKYIMVMAKLEEYKEIYLLRHGDTGLSGKFIGSTDVPLSATGRAEVRRAASSLGKINFKKVLCSPMMRCRQTWEELSLSCETDHNELLKEVDFGLWEGKSFDEVSRNDQHLIDVLVSDYSQFAFPEGESIQMFVSRLSEIVSLLANSPENRILLITHGGVIRHLICLLLSLPFEKYISFDIRTGKYCSLHLFTQGAVITGLNL